MKNNNWYLAEDGTIRSKDKESTNVQVHDAATTVPRNNRRLINTVVLSAMQTAKLVFLYIATRIPEAPYMLFALLSTALYFMYLVTANWGENRGWAGLLFIAAVSLNIAFLIFFLFGCDSLPGYLMVLALAVAEIIYTGSRN